MNSTSTTHVGSLLKLRAIIVPKNQSLKHFARTLEVWPQRALLMCPVSLSSNTGCTLFLEIPLNSLKTEFETVEIDCTILSSVLVGQLSQYRIGLKFNSVSTAAEASLNRVLR